MRIDALPSAALWERLQRALARFPWVRGFTLADGGFMLAVDPTVNRWPRYAALVAAYREGEDLKPPIKT